MRHLSKRKTNQIRSLEKKERYFMKKINRITAILMAAVLVLGITGCGKKQRKRRTD